MTTDGFTTCLWFDGQAEEAAHYYVSVFENSGIGKVVRHTEAGPGPAGSVLTVDFTANGQKFVALNGGPQFRFTEAVSFQISCADQDEVDHYWTRLTEGGGEPGPCGWLKDKYGVSWQVVPDRLIELISDPDEEKAGRAVKAMLTMGKIDIAAVEEAAAGG
ncbi:VOC family protein [Streptomyces sp. ALI-76-A]|jgi:predicted 3-demethylubiquinone-9 3-methyltransferase (glyoxalase superfamily)|uniref:VOC family protein n=1 Tax=Streptomyces sp. ALI-76-A TaxID=3025736 RepID=UPI00256F415F|nr:VOC family protein [Streptomyces sp. ALI-76-A]MDL5199456.1 VOC family protein [Streptomyces sp. ALI-76-A]